MLLSAEFRARLERLALASDGRVRGMWSGRHRSTQLGESLDFADYREYSPGDDFRRIDHSLWARLGVVLVRLFESEDELPLRLVLDRSASMGFDEKMRTAQRLAGMVGFLALAGGDRVMPVRSPGRDRPFEARPALRHLAAWPLLEGWLEESTAEGEAALGAIAHFVAGSVATRGASLVVSDFLGDGAVAALDTFGVAGGGVVLHVMSREELDPSFTGDLRLVDSETGTEVSVSTTPEIMQRYRAAVDRHIDEVRSRARRNGMAYVLVPASSDAHELTLAAMAGGSLVR